MNITIDLNQQRAPLPHFWSKCVGSCHAATALREDWRKHLKKCREDLGFEYVRFHGLFDDDMSVYKADNGKEYYSFFNIDSIVDFLLEIGMKPFFELSFMPEHMASGTSTVFHYKGNTSPPKDYNCWGRLVETFTRHLVDRYGLEEVRKWYFEIWNEPNLSFFWAGTQQEYFTLYKHSAMAIKTVDQGLMVGGPATACNAWIPELRQYCEEYGVPLDFVSTHHYPTDSALGHWQDMEAQMAATERGICRRMVEKALEESGPLPLYYTEWNNSPSCRDSYHDDPYAAAFAVKTIADNLGLVDIYSYWTFSDIFEEAGFSSLPFHGGFGLLNIHGIPKPTYRSFQMLARLGDEKLSVQTANQSPTVDCLATAKGNQLMVLLSNHNVPRAPIQAETVQIAVPGVRHPKFVLAERIDHSHANPKRLWAELGSPEYLTGDQVKRLLAESELKPELVTWTGNDSGIGFDITIQPHSVVAVTIEL